MYSSIFIIALSALAGLSIASLEPPKTSETMGSIRELVNFFEGKPSNLSEKYKPTSGLASKIEEYRKRCPKSVWESEYFNDRMEMLAKENFAELGEATLIKAVWETFRKLPCPSMIDFDPDTTGADIAETFGINTDFASKFNQTDMLVKEYDEQLKRPVEKILKIDLNDIGDKVLLAVDAYDRKYLFLGESDDVKAKRVKEFIEQNEFNPKSKFYHVKHLHESSTGEKVRNLFKIKKHDKKVKDEKQVKTTANKEKKLGKKGKKFLQSIFNHYLKTVSESAYSCHDFAKHVVEALTSDSSIFEPLFSEEQVSLLRMSRSLYKQECPRNLHSKWFDERIAEACRATITQKAAWKKRDLAEFLTLLTVYLHELPCPNRFGMGSESYIKGSLAPAFVFDVDEAFLGKAKEALTLKMESDYDAHLKPHVPESVMLTEQQRKQLVINAVDSGFLKESDVEIKESKIDEYLKGNGFEFERSPAVENVHVPEAVLPVVENPLNDPHIATQQANQPVLPLMSIDPNHHLQQPSPQQLNPLDQSNQQQHQINPHSQTQLVHEQHQTPHQQNRLDIQSVIVGQMLRTEDPKKFDQLVDQFTAVWPGVCRDIQNRLLVDLFVKAVRVAYPLDRVDQILSSPQFCQYVSEESQGAYEKLRNLGNLF